MKRTLTLVTSAFAATTMTSSAALVAGWTSWDTTAATQAVDATTAFAKTVGTWNPEFRASHGDGTFGSQIAGADTTIGIDSSGHKYGLRNPSSNMGGTLDFTITDTSGVDRDLAWFGFDSIQRGSGAASYVLSVLSGDITNGPITGGAGTIGNRTSPPNDLDNFDVDLTGLADSTLDANGTVTFRIEFTQASGRHLELDNVGIAAVPEPSALGLVALSGGLLLRRRRR